MLKWRVWVSPDVDSFNQSETVKHVRLKRFIYDVVSFS